MNQHERAKGGILYAVRGRYSAEKKLHSEGFEYCDVWGDPALLLPIVYPEKKKTKKSMRLASFLILKITPF
ncbi:hypothetical protein [Escherichia coli]|uniref:hypothetical protein n=1 Tax=Escherichia coli TaxID=562 RepID=UPI004068A2EC